MLERLGGTSQTSCTLTSSISTYVHSCARSEIRSSSSLCENCLLRLVAAMTGNDEFHAVAILKDRNAKDRVLALVRGLPPTSHDLEELVGGIEDFWADKEARN